MTIQHTPEEESSPSFSRDPFDEPRTIPGGWDYHALSSMKSCAQDSSPKGVDPDSLMPDDQQLEAEEGSSHKEAFNQPRTYPAHWDITHLT